MKRCKSILSILVIMVCMVLNINFFYDSDILASSLKGQNKIDNKGQSVVILFDVSGSMNSNDSDKLGMDSVMEMIDTLPSYYKVAVIAYADDIRFNTGLVSVKDKHLIQRGFDSLKYDGYSNATLGLQEAIKLLPDKGESNIVMITDGEILLESEDETKKANEMLNAEINNAKKKGIKIHYIGMADEKLINGKMSDIASQTGGQKYYSLGGKDIRIAIDDILINKLGIKRISLGLVNTNEIIKNIKVSLPNESKLNLVIRSDSSIDNLETNFTAKSASQVIGKRYASIQVNKPSISEMNIAVKSTGSEAAVFMIPEASITINPSVTYKDVISKDGEKYDRKANIKIDILDEDGKSLVKSLKDSEVNIIINDNTVQVSREVDKTTLEEKFVLERNVDKEEKLIVTINTDKIPMNVKEVSMGEIILKAPSIQPTLKPVPSPKPQQKEYTSILVVFSVVGIFGMTCILITLFIKNKPIKQVIEEEVKYSYTGRLNIHIKKTARDIDLPSLTFNLFVISNSRPITLEYILKQLKVKEVFLGAENINFLPGNNKQIMLDNNSDCTILDSGKIILKTNQTLISQGNNIDIYFEDEVSQIELEYRE